MNYAVVTTACGVRGHKQCDADHAAASSATNNKHVLGPAVFVANLGSRFSTIGGKDVEFPDPGSDVSRTGKPGQTAPLIGQCGLVRASGGCPAGIAGTCAFRRS